MLFLSVLVVAVAVGHNVGVVVGGNGGSSGGSLCFLLLLLLLLLQLLLLLVVLCCGIIAVVAVAGGATASMFSFLLLSDMAFSSQLCSYLSWKNGSACSAVVVMGRCGCCCC